MLKKSNTHKIEIVRFYSSNLKQIMDSKSDIVKGIKMLGDQRVKALEKLNKEIRKVKNEDHPIIISWVVFECIPDGDGYPIYEFKAAFKSYEKAINYAKETTANYNIRLKDMIADSVCPETYYSYVGFRSDINPWPMDNIDIFKGYIIEPIIIQ